MNTSTTNGKTRNVGQIWYKTREMFYSRGGTIATIQVQAA